MNCPKCRRILQSGYCATHGRIVSLIRKGSVIGIPSSLHGAAFQSAFDKAFGLEPFIHSKQAGTSYIPCHPNMPATSTKTMLGDGHVQPFPPPINIIEPEAGATVFSTNTTTPLPASGTTLHQFQSSGRKSEVYPEYRERKSSMLVMALRNPV